MDMATFGSLGVTLFLAMMGMEVFKFLFFRWAFPEVKEEPLFGKDEKKHFYGMKIKIDQLPSTVLTLTDEEHKALMDIRDILSVKDQDGVPICYVPRSLITMQADNLELSRDSAYIQRDLSKNVADLVSAVTKLADRATR